MFFECLDRIFDNFFRFTILNVLKNILFIQGKLIIIYDEINKYFFIIKSVSLKSNKNCNSKNISVNEIRVKRKN